ncbi:MAG: class I SAM-dependent methyltransferase [Gammaproteobacteria bacterium]|nr:class I SAM-dependent methyltransferase [Gammaproteobacteria bacterium]
MANLLSTKTPWDLVASAYADITMPMFRTYASAALKLLELKPQDSLVDIACGPGTVALLAAPNVESIDALDFSEPMIKILDDIIREQNIRNIKTICGDGQDMPYENNQFDAAISLFGLMFFDDRAKAYAEIRRTLKPGGKAVISCWAPVSESNGFQLVFGTLRQINPNIPAPQTDIESLENPEFFRNELEQAGFRDVEIHRVTGEIPFTNVKDFWNDMVQANAPIAMYKNSMSDEAWQEKNQIALNYLKEQTATKPEALQAHAWLGIGKK